MFFSRVLRRKYCLIAASLLAANTLAAFGSTLIYSDVKSSPTPHFTVTNQLGKPIAGAKIEIYREEIIKVTRNDLKPPITILTDANGHAVSPKLHPGRYHVVASAKLNLSDQLFLNVSLKTSQSHSAFSMYLRPGIIPTSGNCSTLLKTGQSPCKCASFTVRFATPKATQSLTPPLMSLTKARWASRMPSNSKPMLRGDSRQT